MVSGGEDAFSFHSEEIPPPREHALRVSCPWADSILGCSRRGTPPGAGDAAFPPPPHHSQGTLVTPAHFFVDFKAIFQAPPGRIELPKPFPEDPLCLCGMMSHC